MNEVERLILENQEEIMQFLLYPRNPDGLLKQRNMTAKALAPNNKEFEFKDTLASPQAEVGK